jgi:hypothetical protein
MVSKAFLTVNEVALEWKCSKMTVYRKVRKAEKAIGRPILITKMLQGRNKLVIGRSDIERIAKASGIDVEVGELAQISETLEALVSGTIQTAELLKRVANRLGVT